MKARPQKWGIILGRESPLTDRLLKRIIAKKVPFVIVSFGRFYQEAPCLQLDSLGKLGSIIGFFQKQQVTSVVMFGAMTRFGWGDLFKIDLLTWGVFFKFLLTGTLFRGDDVQLRFAKKLVEKYGCKLYGVQDILPEIIAPVGLLTKRKPTAKEHQLIMSGIRAAKALGQADRGQAVLIFYDGSILCETQRGTDRLIQEGVKRRQEQGLEVRWLLVKLKKPQQLETLDLPTMGLHTLEAVIHSGGQGIIYSGESTIFEDQKEMIKMADQHHIFIEGLPK